MPECTDGISLEGPVVDDDVTSGELDVDMTAAFDEFVVTRTVIFGELRVAFILVLGIAFTVVFGVAITLVLRELGGTVVVTLVGRTLGGLTIKEDFEEDVSGF